MDLDLNIILWILQILLAIAFLLGGFVRAFRFETFASNPQGSWARDVGQGPLRIIGLLEIAGAVGLILPAATGVVPWLNASGCAGPGRGDGGCVGVPCTP